MPGHASPPPALVSALPASPPIAEPADGSVALLLHPHGHVEHVYQRLDQAAADAGYIKDLRWFLIDEEPDIGPMLWTAVSSHHDGRIVIVEIPPAGAW